MNILLPVGKGDIGFSIIYAIKIFYPEIHTDLNIVMKNLDLQK
jgi:hypothetical protein